MKYRLLLLTLLAIIMLGGANLLYGQVGEGEVNSSDEAVHAREDVNFWEAVFSLVATPLEFVYEKGSVDLETGAIFTGYSDVRIPGDTGTLFSLSDDLKADVAPSFRFRITLPLGERHNISWLAAPLVVYSDGKVDRDIVFAGETYPAGTDLKGTYWFNSHRLTYRYDFINNFRTDLGVGFTAKIREAGIRLEGGGLKSSKTNVGFVPIVNFRYNQYLGEKWSLLIEGDALAAPQGRAEDVYAGVTYKIVDGVRLKLGYRLLEGGADNDEVYNFALLHYATVGVILGK